MLQLVHMNDTIMAVSTAPGPAALAAKIAELERSMGRDANTEINFR